MQPEMKVLHKKPLGNYLIYSVEKEILGGDYIADFSELHNMQEKEDRQKTVINKEEETSDE